MLSSAGAVSAVAASALRAGRVLGVQSFASFASTLRSVGRAWPCSAPACTSSFSTAFTASTNGMLDSIGRTPLLRLRRLSEQTGCDILGKAEFMNPGGSVKDRAALGIILDAMRRGVLRPGGEIVEGTAGNTGIGLALVGNALGCRTTIVIPETQSEEKKQMLRICGVELVQVPAAPYSNPNNYVHVSERLAKERGAFWAMQFDNVANRDFHTATTGPEIWTQTSGRVDAFTCAVGTGGTLAGVAAFLRSVKPGVKIGLADPLGAALYSYYTTGQLKAEGSSITEGIGQGRITKNIEAFKPDVAMQIPDDEALRVLYDLVKDEGLVLGTSSGINVAAAVRMAKQLGPGHTIVTVLCDGGQRYASKLFNVDFLTRNKLPLPTYMHGVQA